MSSAEISTRTPIDERPPVDDMATEDLREEYQTFDIVHLASSEQHDRWDRAMDVWNELDSRDLVEWPECDADGCSAREWKFEVGGPAYCGECGHPASTAEKAQAVQETATKLIHGGGDDE